MPQKSVDHRWGDYYWTGQRAGKKSWILEVVYTINQNIPSFNELFDRETFYVFAVLFVLATILIVLLLSMVFKIRLREYPIDLSQREWRDWRPANPFLFPWQISKNNKPHKD